MCRLLAFSSLERKSFYDVVGNEFDKFVAMSEEHKDVDECIKKLGK